MHYFGIYQRNLDGEINLYNLAKKHILRARVINFYDASNHNSHVKQWLFIIYIIPTLHEGSYSFIAIPTG